MHADIRIAIEGTACCTQWPLLMCMLCSPCYFEWKKGILNRHRPGIKLPRLLSRPHEADTLHVLIDMLATLQDEVGNAPMPGDNGAINCPA